MTSSMRLYELILLLLVLVLEPSTAWPHCPPIAVTCGEPQIKPLWEEIEEAGKKRSLNKRIVGGYEANAHSWPWQIFLEWDNGAYCGGSIISECIVVTAAHCVTQKVDGVLQEIDNSRLTVFAGIHNRVTKAAASKQERTVVHKIIHEDYHEMTGLADNFDNDIAILILNETFTWTNEVLPVCLPDSAVVDGSLNVATGWGETQGTPGADNTFLQELPMNIIDQVTCSTDSAYWPGYIEDDMVCAGPTPNTTLDSICQGDSGGPLVGKDGTQYELNGITSFSSPTTCGVRPGVFVRVSYYMDNGWLQTKTKGRYYTV